MEDIMPDAKVQAAIANWAPRFTSQGVDYNDFMSTTSRIETWNGWLDAWADIDPWLRGCQTLFGAQTLSEAERSPPALAVGVCH